MAPNFEPRQGLRPLFLFALIVLLLLQSSQVFADAWIMQNSSQYTGVLSCTKEEACNDAIGAVHTQTIGCPSGNETQTTTFTLQWSNNACQLTSTVSSPCSGSSHTAVTSSPNYLPDQDCPDEEPSNCTQGETFSGQVADSNDVCSGGCVATPDTRPPDAIGYGLTMSDGSPLPGWYGTYTYSGETCTVEPEAPPAENCLTDLSGNQYCYEPQDQNCGTINGESVCVGQPDGCGTFNGVSMCPDDQGCYDMPSGSRVCPDGVQTPPAPDDGTPGQPADPDGEITDGDGNTFNYFGPGTVDGSTDETPEECPPGETCDGEGEEECPEGEDCGNWDGSGEMDDVPGPGDKLDQAKAELSNKISQIRGEAASMIGLWDATGEASLPSASAETSLGTVTISVQDYGGWVGMLRGILFFAVALGCFFIVLENGFGGDK